jgi:hypothetical protein
MEIPFALACVQRDKIWLGGERMQTMVSEFLAVVMDRLYGDNRLDERSDLKFHQFVMTKEFKLFT